MSFEKVDLFPFNKTYLNLIGLFFFSFFYSFSHPSIFPIVTITKATVVKINIFNKDIGKGQEIYTPIVSL